MLPRCGSRARGLRGFGVQRIRKHHQVHCCAASKGLRSVVQPRVVVDGNMLRVLHSFWEARGVVDPEKRQKLVDTAIEQLQGFDETAKLQPDQPLPGVEASWSSDTKAAEVTQVSQRLLRLQELLGGEGVDVVWMVVREPRLLSADFSALTTQLWELKLESLDLGVDLIRVLERQPGLLLQQGGAAAAISAVAASQEAPAARTSTHSPESSTATSSTPTNGASMEHGGASSSGESLVGSRAERMNGSASSSTTVGGASSSVGSTSTSNSSSSSSSSTAAANKVETASEKLQAWEYGLVTDNDREWARRLGQLEEYHQRHGDAHVGFRDGDDAELTRWASKQRAGHRRGELTYDRIERLQTLGFEFKEEEAEWQRWYKELLAFKSQHGHCSPPPLATGVDFYLINWCSVQRVALRSKVMPASRQELLDQVGFDWTGADPLS